MLVLFSIVLGGCLVSKEAFYTKSSIQADDRIVGSFTAKDDETIYSIRKTSEPGVYRLTLQDHGDRSEFQAVSFRAGKSTFLDLSSPNSPVRTEEKDSSSVGAALNRVTSGGRHFIVRLDAANDILRIAVLTDSGIERLLKTEPKLKHRALEDDVIELSASAADLNKILEKHGHENGYFDNIVELTRSKG